MSNGNDYDGLPRRERRRRKLEDYKQSNEEEWHRLVASYSEEVDRNNNDQASSPQDFFDAEMQSLDATLLYKECDKILTTIQKINDTGSTEETTQMKQKAASASAKEHDRELCQNYRNLLAMNRYLEKEINTFTRTTEVVEGMVQDLDQIHAVLTTVIKENEETSAADETTNSTFESSKSENRQLREDLVYASKLLSQQKSHRLNSADDTASSNESVDDPYMQLDQLLMKLVNLMLLSPENPYLSVKEHNIDPTDIALLKSSLMIQHLPGDSTLLRLLDYSE